MTITMILDASAVAEYGKNSIHVGEPITLLFEEPGRTFAVPATSLAEATATSGDLDSVILLGRHPLAEVTGFDGARWAEMAQLSRLLGGPAYAIPLMAAREHDAYLLTAQPDRYPDINRIIDIGQ